MVGQSEIARYGALDLVRDHEASLAEVNSVMSAYMVFRYRFADPDEYQAR